MIKDVMKLVSAKSFNYKKALAAYYANSNGKVKVFPKNPTDSDISRLKLEMQNLIQSKKNPVDKMDYFEMKQKVEELELEVPSNKKKDIYPVLKAYYDEHGY